MAKFYGFSAEDVKAMTLYQLQIYMFGLVGGARTEMEITGVKDIIHTVNQMAEVEKENS